MILCFKNYFDLIELLKDFVELVLFVCQYVLLTPALKINYHSINAYNNDFFPPREFSPEKNIQLYCKIWLVTTYGEIVTVELNCFMSSRKENINGLPDYLVTLWYSSSMQSSLESVISETAHLTFFELLKHPKLRARYC